jgi:hypothetical protein
MLFQLGADLPKKTEQSQCRSMGMRGTSGWGTTAVDQESVEYFRERERIERAAAKAAATEAARRAHLELAQGYAALARKG